MRIGAVSYKCRTRDIEFNLAQIERALREAAGRADLLCFSEAFVQGFDSLDFDYEKDKNMALSFDSEPIKRLCALTLRYDTALLTGWIEREGESIYSSCLVVAGGRVIHNYRRISPGWKEPNADWHYREGEDTAGFTLMGVRMKAALCGDLWFAPERFGTEGVLIWPVYVNYTPGEWEGGELYEYAAHACSVAPKTIMINPIDEAPRCWGGSFLFEEGKVKYALPFGEEGILFAEIDDK